MRRKKNENSAAGMEPIAKEKSKIGKKILGALEIIFLVIMIAM